MESRFLVCFLTPKKIDQGMKADYSNFAKRQIEPNECSYTVNHLEVKLIEQF